MMAFRQSAREIEAQWQVKIRSQGTDYHSCAPLLTVCGPSGVGKTTVVGALARHYSVYIETTDGNPHLKGLLEGKVDFNAAANQKWFLQRIGEHVTPANPCSPLILDQDPAAVVLTYSRMFLEDRKITEGQYKSLLRELLKIEEMLHRWRHPRAVLFLDAPAVVLHRRVLGRWGDSQTPPLAWFDRVRTHFLELYTRFTNATTVSTVDLTQEQVISRTRSLLENCANGSQP